MVFYRVLQVHGALLVEVHVVINLGSLAFLACDLDQVIGDACDDLIELHNVVLYSFEGVVLEWAYCVAPWYGFFGGF